MPPAAAPRVFLDANVLVSASLSPAGPAYALLQAVQSGAIAGFTSVEAVSEARRAIAEYEPDAAAVLDRILGRARLRVRQGPKTAAPFEGLAHAKDRHVVAAAVRFRANYLVTFNVRDFRGRRLRELFQLHVVHPAALLRALGSFPRR